MKSDSRIAGAVLILAGCVILDQPVPRPLFVYAIVLNAVGICMLVPVLSNILRRLFGKAESFQQEVADEIRRQKS